MSAEVVKENKKELVDFETLLKEGKSLNDVDFSKVELVGGKTLDNIEEKCLEKCQEYLAGNWGEQTLNTIEVRRITGGLLNQLYYCGVRQPLKTIGTPQEVAIKFYGSLGEVDTAKIRELVISLIFSEKGLGPKIYGYFEGGQIQRFYKQRHFSMDDKNNPAIVKKVFVTLAKIHSLDVPIKKSGNNVMERLNKSDPEAIERFNKLVEEHNCETFRKYDLKTEIDWIIRVIEKLNSPVVFCHLDYRSSNLLITEPDNKLVVCDFDMSSYNYRGSDFSMMMKEWNKTHYFLNEGDIEGIPLRGELRPFIEMYVEEGERIHGKGFTENLNNSIEHIMNEAKVFLLLSYLQSANILRTSLPKGDRRESFNSKLMIEMCETNYKNYITIKGILKAQKIFD